MAYYEFTVSLLLENYPYICNLHTVEKRIVEKTTAFKQLQFVLFNSANLVPTTTFSVFFIQFFAGSILPK